MKATKILLLCLALLSPVFLKAQDRWGIHAGVNFSSLRYEKTDVSEEILDDWYETKTGMLVGVFYEHPINDKVGIHAGLEYSQAGVKAKYPIISDVNLQYLSMPVLFYYKPHRLVKLSVGPTVNFLLHESESEVDYTFPLDRFKTVDYGATLGAEFICSERFGIVVSNYFGLQYNGEFDVRNIDIEDQENFGMNRNNIFHVGVQYYLR